MDSELRLIEEIEADRARGVAASAADAYNAEQEVVE